MSIGIAINCTSSHYSRRNADIKKTDAPQRLYCCLALKRFIASDTYVSK